jgi:hypothetical protein
MLLSYFLLLFGFIIEKLFLDFFGIGDPEIVERGFDAFQDDIDKIEEIMGVEEFVCGVFFV